MNPCSLHAKPKALWGCQRSSLTSQRQVSGTVQELRVLMMILLLHAWVFTPKVLSGYQASSSGRSPVSTQASSAAVVAPGQWLGPMRNRPISSTTTASNVQHLYNFCCGSCCPTYLTHTLQLQKMTAHHGNLAWNSQQTSGSLGILIH